MAKEKYTKEQKKIIRKFRALAVKAFAAVMLIGCVMGFLFFFRPATSQVEKRKLTEFPKFTVSSFLDGSFFSQVSLWYSDTFPMRDTLIAADKKVKDLYGIESSTMMVGGHEQGDAIPAAGDKKDKETEDSTQEEESQEPVTAPDSQEMEAEIQNQIQQGLYVKDGAAYSVYYFNQGAAETYTDALNQAAEELDGIAKVYSLFLDFCLWQ